MSKRWVLVALLAVAVSGITGACESGASTASPVAVAATASPSASSSAAAAAATATPTAAPTAEPTPVPTPTPTAVPTPKPTPVPWAVYKSKRYKYSIKHPPDWIVTPGSASRSDVIDDFGSHFVYIYRDTVSTWVDVQGSVDAEKAFIKSHYKAKLLTDKRVHVGALSGRLVTFNGTVDGRKMYIQHLIIARGKVGYLITMFSDTGHKVADQKLFLRIYNSFKPTS